MEVGSKMETGLSELRRDMVIEESVLPLGSQRGSGAGGTRYQEKDRES